MSGSMARYWPVMLRRGSATARVWSATPYVDSMSFFAFNNAAFWASAVVIAFATESGRVSQAGRFVDATSAACDAEAAMKATITNSVAKRLNISRVINVEG